MASENNSNSSKIMIYIVFIVLAIFTGHLIKLTDLPIDKQMSQQRAAILQAATITMCSIRCTC